MTGPTQPGQLARPPQQPARVRPDADDRQRVKPIFEACAVSLRMAAHDITSKPMRADRLDQLQARLAAALAEVERMRAGPR